jgi:hypothetical protein
MGGWAHEGTWAFFWGRVVCYLRGFSTGAGGCFCFLVFLVMGRGVFSSFFLTLGGFCKKRRGISCDGFWTYHVHIPACDQPAVFFLF